ncbi:MAG: hypothetical protein U5L95_03900 [Candidatus Saccharibacteria bacterium]|nr:hypothetical protein [Candidatus Saccharibacteria bacterium]
MTTQNDTIELNGYKYDARTGEQLGRVANNAGVDKPRSVDGFTPVRRIAPQKTVTPKTPTPSHAVHNKVNKSKTLRRQGLAKPALSSEANTTPSRPIAKRTMQPDQARVSRAQQVQKHPHVAKFQAKTSTQPMEIKSPPPEQPAQDTSAEPEPAKRSVLPLSPFDMALQRANSHEQPAPSKLTFRERASRKLRISPRALSTGLGVLLVLSVGGLFAKQHLPTLAVQLAATRAGVEAKLPGYEPAGFDLSGPIEYSTGQIALSYQSNSADDRNFKIVQQNSDWNSQALLENYVQASDRPFQTVQDKGKTIYIYGDNNATWVSGGVWFQVEGESSLNTDQLLRIASGL